MRRATGPRAALALVLGIAICASAGAQLSTTRAQLWHQDVPGVPESRNDNDFFAWALASGDFDGDGYADLAIGVPLEDVVNLSNMTIVDAGEVLVLYGSRAGLTASRAQVWQEDPADVEGTLEAGDKFGRALAVGNFNGDAYDDLAVGVPGQDYPYLENVGAAHVFYGSASGLSAVGDQVWPPYSAFGADDFEEFGSALAAGDFDGDGYDELAVGKPRHGGAGPQECGGVNVFAGSPLGLVEDGVQSFSTITLGGTAEAFDHFGAALATGDLDGDGYEDLAIGVPGDDFVGVLNNGSVHVLFGAAAGLSDASQYFMLGAAQGDEFGLALAAADFDADGIDDLAAARPGATIAGALGAGAVEVRLGSAGGLGAPATFHQNTPGIAGVCEVEDYFGQALATGDFDHDGYADLAIAAPLEDYGAVDSGVVHVLRGGPGGITTTGSQLWSQTEPGVPESEDPYDFFGHALAAGDFDGTGHADLAIGLPGEPFAGTSQGAAVVLHGVLFADGFESADSSRWSSTSP